MKLNALVAQPQLIKCVLDDEDTVKEFNEPLEWWIWDRQPIDIFLKFATESSNSSEQIVRLLKEMVLDEEGKPMLMGDATLPTKILMKVMAKMTETLGK
jgi:hypothetical protein